MRILLALLLLSIQLGAQEYYNDAQIRASLGLEKRINKKFSVTLDQQYRFTKNITEFNRASYDIGINWKVNKWLKLKADYVFIEKKNKYNYFTERNWYYIAVVLKHEYKSFKFFYRNMVQARGGVMNSDESGVFKLYDRNKITIRHETTRRLSIWVASEIYIPLNSPQAKGIERVRGFLGGTLKTAKGQSLDLYFMLQQQLQRNKWFDQEYRYPTQYLNRYFIYGINYNIEF